MEIGLIVVGDEILSGRRSDKHLDSVIELLAKRDLRLSWCQILADDLPQLTRAYRAVLESGSIAFSCGGIGGTPDDLTRQAVADASHRALLPHPEGVEILKRVFGAELSPERQRMVEFPTGARLIPNPINQVPGFSIDHLHCVPGFPKMAKPMIEWVLENEYADIEGIHQFERTIRINDARESDLIPLMESILASYPQVKIFCLPTLKKAARWVDLGVKGGDIAQVESAFEALKQGMQAFDLEWRTLG